MAKKEQQAPTINVNGTLFNVQPIHVTRIENYIKAGYSPIIIHGDGSMFAGAMAMEGSDHHKEFNSGVAEINKNEVVSRAKFRAIFEKGNPLPSSVDEIVKAFFDNFSKETQNVTKAVVNDNFKNAISIAD